MQKENTFYDNHTRTHGQRDVPGPAVTLVGTELSVGDSVPDFTVAAANDLADVTFADLSENHTKAVLFILVPSIDTSVCSLETGKFDRHVASLPKDKIKVVTVSADTPFAQKRWADKEGVANLELLSDFKDRAFADAFGVRMKEMGMLARSIYLADKNGVIQYVQVVPEMASEPDYDAALSAARAIL